MHNIAVGNEGECIYTLRPKTQKVSARLLCHVSLKGHVKVVTLRSTFLVKNNTLFPLELMLIDYNGQPTSVVEKIGETEICILFFFFLIIDQPRTMNIPSQLTESQKAGLQCDLTVCFILGVLFFVLYVYSEGFGYKWSNPLQWEELTVNRTRLFVCRHAQSSEPAWRLQACAEFNSNDTLTK